MAAPKSLEEQIADLAVIVAEQGKRLDAHGVVLTGIAAVFNGGGVGEVKPATDAELDGQHGNPTMKFNPRDWKGPPRKGWNLSRCEPEALDAYAEQSLYFASKEDEKGEKDNRGAPKSKWSRKNAALAMGWARRLRAGWKPTDAPAAQERDAWGRPKGSPPASTERQAWGGEPQQSTGASVDDPYAERGDGNDGSSDEIPFATTSLVRRRFERIPKWERL